VWVRIFSRPSVRRTPVKETRCPEKTVLDCMVRLCILSSSSNIVGVIKSRRMRWAGNVARMGEEIGVYVWGLGGETGEKDTTGET